MTCDLDVLGIESIMMCVSHRALVAKEDTMTGMNINFSVAIVAGKSTDVAAKDAEEETFGHLP